MNSFLPIDFRPLCNVLSACTRRARMSQCISFGLAGLRQCPVLVCSVLGLISPRCDFLGCSGLFTSFMSNHEFSLLKDVQRLSVSLKSYARGFVFISPLVCLSPRPFPSCPLPYPRPPGFPSAPRTRAPRLPVACPVGREPPYVTQSRPQSARWFAACMLQDRTYWA